MNCLYCCQFCLLITVPGGIVPEDAAPATEVDKSEKTRAIITKLRDSDIARTSLPAKPVEMVSRVEFRSNFYSEPVSASLTGQLSPGDSVSEIDRVGLELFARVQLRQPGIAILPHQQHRTLRREALMPDVGRHRANIARLHHCTRARYPAIPIRDLPMNFVAQLHEPFDAVVAMNNRQGKFLSGRTQHRVLHHRAD